MTTAIAVYTSDGCVGRCDAKCHNATAPECDCICGGRLHGAGDQAIQLHTDWIDPDGELRRRFAQLHGHDPADLRLEFAQLELFPATSLAQNQATDPTTQPPANSGAPQRQPFLEQHRERQPSPPRPAPSTGPASRPASPTLPTRPSARRDVPTIGR